MTNRYQFAIHERTTFCSMLWKLRKFKPSLNQLILYNDKHNFMMQKFFNFILVLHACTVHR